MGGVDAVAKLYRYFLFINDTVRGPFLPGYLSSAKSKRCKKWYWLLVSTLQFDPTGTVRLVAPYMSSEYRVHAQSMVFAMDVNGLQLSRSSFRCYEEKLDTIFISEMGLAGQILNAQQNVASFAALYDGIDFRVTGAPINNAVNPTRSFYEKDLWPMEVMFVKCAGDLKTTRPNAWDFYAHIEWLTDWAYTQRIHRLSCDAAFANDEVEQRACLAKLAALPVVDLHTGKLRWRLQCDCLHV